MVQRWFSVILLVLGLSGCGAVPEATHTKPYIMSTFSILGDITTQVVGDSMAVEVLVDRDNDPHVYEASPADVARLTDADTIITLGLEFEGWFTDLYTASGSTATVIVASTPLTPRSLEAHESDGATDDHGHDEYDPHVWQDVQNVILMVDYIQRELSDRYPALADTFMRNSAAYISKLEALDADIVARTATIPEAQRLLVTNHESLGYFAARYGYTLVDSILGASSTEGGDPSAAQIADLSVRLKELGVRSIFVENVSNDQIAQNLAQESGIIVAPPLYTDALGALDTPGASYIGMMQYNMDTIASALHP